MKVTFYKDGKDEHRWRLDADNGEPLAVSSEGYRSQESVVHGFELTSGAHVSMGTGVAIRLETPDLIDDQETERIGVEVVE